MADSKFNRLLESLDSVTKADKPTHLRSAFYSLKSYSERSVSAANKCDFPQMINDIILAATAGVSLRREAENGIIEDKISHGEWLQIHNDSINLVFKGLVEEISKSLTSTCGCKGE